MEKSCLHTHTTFCDGQDEIETFCETAYQKGFGSLGFSAHAPIFRKTGFKSDWHLPEDRMEAYFEAVRAARRRWEGKLRIFLGLEIDYIKGLIGPADRDFQELGLDYCIGSVHYLLPPNEEPFTVDGPLEEFEQGLHRGFSGDINALVGAYWDAVEAMIREGGFDILGHTDLIKKNNPQDRWFSLEREPYFSLMRRIADLFSVFSKKEEKEEKEEKGKEKEKKGKKRKKEKIVVEVNTGGLNRYKTADPYPGLSMLRQLKEKNVPVIITADAHKAEHLGGHYEEARNILLQAGYTKAVLFEGRVNGSPVWIDDPLT